MQRHGDDSRPRRRRSIRLKRYDYSEPGAYFVTICTHGWRCILGSVTGDQVNLSPFGQIVQTVWCDLPTQYPNVELDAFVVMPNHFHGILLISGSVAAIQDCGRDHANDPSVGAIHELPLPIATHNVPLPRHENCDWVTSRRRMLLPRLIGRFKMISAKRINELRGSRGFPVWQRNYFEHVIRSDKGLERIRQYIMENPARWHLDRQNPERVRNDDRYPW